MLENERKNEESGQPSLPGGLATSIPMLIYLVLVMLMCGAFSGLMTISQASPIFLFIIVKRLDFTSFPACFSFPGYYEQHGKGIVEYGREYKGHQNGW